jgi:hypothetical protein
MGQQSPKHLRPPASGAGAASHRLGRSESGGHHDLDSSRFNPGNLYARFTASFLRWRWATTSGETGVSREIQTRTIPFSIAGRNSSGIDTVAVDVAYLIEAALLKGHVSTGVTLGAKNYFVATSIDPDWRN